MNPTGTDQFVRGYSWKWFGNRNFIFYLIIAGISLVVSIHSIVSGQPEQIMMMVYFIIVLFVFKEILKLYQTTKEISGPITTSGIQVDYAPLIPWSKVYDVKQGTLNGRTYLVFDLKKGQNNYARENMKPSLHSYHFNEFILVGGIYFADDLYRKIIPHWEANNPKKIYYQIKKKLVNKYKFKEQENKELTGSLSELDITCKIHHYMGKKQLTLELNSKESHQFYLNIQPETNTSKLKQAIGINDVQIGQPTLDKQYLFQTSHPSVFQQLFTEDVINRFERLVSLGTVNWSFGKPLKRKRIQAPKSSIDDTEDILDTNLLKTEEQKTDYEIIGENTYNKLEFNGILNQSLENADETAEFTELSLELSVLLAELLREI